MAKSFFSLVTELETLLGQLNIILAGADDETVQVNGVTKDSISKAIKDNFASLQAIVNGRKAYKTKAEMDSDTSVNEDQLAEVWNDPTENNNGLYGFTSGAWVKSAYDTFSTISKLDLLLKELAKASSSLGLEKNAVNFYGPDDHSGYRNYFQNTVSKVDLKGVKCLYFSETQNFTRSIPKEAFTSGYVSASVYIQEIGSLRGSTSHRNRLVIFQYDSSGTEISRATAWAGTDLNPEWLVVEGFEIEPNCENVKFYIGAERSELYISQVLFSDSLSGGFRASLAPLNMWPDPNMICFGMLNNGYERPVISKDLENEQAYTFEPKSDDVSYMWEFDATNNFSPGSHILFSGKFACASGVASLRAYVNFYDENYNLISSISDANNTSSTEDFNCRGYIPADTFKVEVGFVHYASATSNAYVKGIVLNTDVSMSLHAPDSTQISKEISYQLSGLKNDLSEKINFNQAYANTSLSYGNLIKDPVEFTGFTGAKRKLINGVLGAEIVSTYSRVSTIRIDPSRFSNQIGSFGLSLLLNNTTSGRILIRMMQTDIVEATDYRVTRNLSELDLVEDGAIAGNWANIVLSGFYVPTDIIQLKHVEIYIDTGPSTDERSICFFNPWLVPVNISYPQNSSNTFDDFWVDPTMSGNMSDMKGSVLASSQSLPELVISTENTFKGRTYKFPANGDWQPGSSFYFHGELYVSPDSFMPDKTEVAVIYYNESGGEISRQSVLSSRFSSYGIFEGFSLEILVPAETYEIAVRCGARGDSSGGGFVESKFRNFIVSKSIQSSPWFKVPKGINSLNTITGKTVFVSPNGSDEDGLGTENEPFLTGARCAQELPNGGTIVMMGGDHISFNVPLDSITGTLLISKPSSDSSRIIQSDKKIPNGWLKQDGLSNVWRIAHSSYSGAFIWEHETPQHLIDESERHALQRGRKYRLPSFRLIKVDDLTECDANPGTWYYGEDGALYIHSSDSSDPNLKEFYIPSSLSLTSGNHSKVHLNVKNIDLWYAGFNVDNLGSYELHNVRNIGSLYNGCDRGSSNGIENRVEFAGNNNDGGNAHNTNSPWNGPEGDVPPASKVTSVDMYCHDNYDDGDSLHERCEGTYIGGLWEYNGDRGVATSYGAHVTIYNGIARRNGFYDTSMGQQNPGASAGGEGFACVGITSEDEYGVGTQMNLFNCVSSYNNLNFALNRGGSGDRMECNNCASEYGRVAGYSAELANRIMTLRNCTDLGSAIPKREVQGGQIIVKNGNLVT